MSHLDTLPNEFDVIVLGTGLPESILAAACARSGFSVLHLDRNDYYGGEWASFNFEGLQHWIQCNDQHKSSAESPLLSDEHFASLLLEGEHIIRVATRSSNVCNVTASVQTESTKQDAQVAACDDVVSNEVNATDLPAILTDNWRRFSIDLSPKLMLSRGAMVDLLVTSGVGRYAEFKLVERILTKFESSWKEVPCSRADVFHSKDISMLEKRQLMKFVTFCLNYEQNTEEFAEFRDSTFSQFLEAKQLTATLRHYVIHALAMVSPEASTEEGLRCAHRFLMSVGRYGNSPFLFPLYGCGELPQCFCRLCAVFGGTYYLRRSIEALVINAQGACSAVITEGQRINCRWLVAERSYVHAQQSASGTEYTSRAILLTDRSVLPATKDMISVTSLSCPHLRAPVRVLELGSDAMVCPKGVNLVHMFAAAERSAQEDLQPLVRDMFHVGGETLASDGDTCLKPRLLWSLFFNQVAGLSGVSELMANNVLVLPGPDGALDFEAVVQQAREAFRTLWPEEEFLPIAPNPDEVSIADQDVGVNGFVPDAPKEAETSTANVEVPTEETPEDSAVSSTANADELIPNPGKSARHSPVEHNLL